MARSESATIFQAIGCLALSLAGIPSPAAAAPNSWVNAYKYCKDVWQYDYDSLEECVDFEEPFFRYGAPPAPNGPGTPGACHPLPESICEYWHDKYDT